MKRGFLNNHKPKQEYIPIKLGEFQKTTGLHPGDIKLDPKTGKIAVERKSYWNKKEPQKSAHPSAAKFPTLTIKESFPSWQRHEDGPKWYFESTCRFDVKLYAQADMIYKTEIWQELIGKIQDKMEIGEKVNTEEVANAVCSCEQKLTSKTANHGLIIAPKPGRVSKLNEAGFGHLMNGAHRPQPGTFQSELEFHTFPKPRDSYGQTICVGFLSLMDRLGQITYTKPPPPPDPPLHHIVQFRILGTFTASDVKQGTIIVRDRPLLIASERMDSVCGSPYFPADEFVALSEEEKIRRVYSAWETIFEEALDVRLPEEEQKKWQKLSDTVPVQEPGTMSKRNGLFRAFSIRCGGLVDDDGFQYAGFPREFHAGTLHHSCTPNVKVSFNSENFVFEYSALQDLSADDELLCDYFAETAGVVGERRRNMLKRRAVQCSEECKVCWP